jgi:hypothetical protein
MKKDVCKQVGFRLIHHRMRSHRPPPLPAAFSSVQDNEVTTVHFQISS